MSLLHASGSALKWLAALLLMIVAILVLAFGVKWLSEPAEPGNTPPDYSGLTCKSARFDGTRTVIDKHPVGSTWTEPDGRVLRCDVEERIEQR